MNKDEIYVIRQPQRVIFSVVIMDTGFPISKSSHNYLDKLGSFSDIHLVFNDSLFSSRLVNKKKFTALYECGSFMCCSGNTVLPQILKSLEYSLEIFKKHFTFLLFKLSDLEKLSEVEFDKLSENVRGVSQATIERPVLKIERLGNEELYEYYKKTSLEIDHHLDGFFLKGLTTIGDAVSSRLYNYIAQKENDEDQNNIYATWKTISKVQVFKKSVIKKFLEYNEAFPGYVKTFSGERIDQVFPSLLVRLDIKNHNQDIEGLKL